MITSVLFDLDGTLINTAPDLVFALNKLREEQGFDQLPLSTIRPLIGQGSMHMVKRGLEIEEDDPQFRIYRQRFLDLYQNHIADSTQFFPQIENVLTFLEKNRVAWGIVTNKLTLHTTELLKALQFHDRPHCIVCGDTLSTSKPNPEPILYACELLKSKPETCLYIGDSLSDVTASKAAGVKSLVALYGYIGESENPHSWLADGYVNAPIEIVDWILRK